jgi:hypothetical protein
MTGMPARPFTFVASWIALVGLTVVLHAFGQGALVGPPLLHLDRIAAWWQARGPMVATFAVARELLYWVGCYLSGLWTAAVVARSIHSKPLAAALSLCRLPGARAVLKAAFGASALGVGLVTTAGPSFATGGVSPSGPTATSSGPAPVLRYLGPASPDLAPVAGRTAGAAPVGAPGAAPKPSAVGAKQSAGTPISVSPASPATTPPHAPATSPATTPPHAPAANPATTPPHAPAAGPTAPARPRPAVRAGTPTPEPSSLAVRPTPHPQAAGEWVVRPGDDLWSIAATTLTRAWGRPPTESELARFWWQVVQTNRPHLPNPGDPNLLFPGDMVTVPAPPSPPG